METQGPNTRAPVVAAFDAATGVREPVEFGIAASDVTGAPLIIAVVHTGDKGSSLEQLREDLQRRGLDDVEIRTFEDRTAARGLARALDEVQPALIVLGSSKRSAIGSVFVGTTAERVIHASSCPVAVVPKGYERPEGGVKVIGAAYSPSDEGREALHAAASLARAGGARVRAIMVLDPKHAGEQSSSMMAGQHHSTSPSEGDAAVERLSDEAELNEAVAKLGVEAESRRAGRRRRRRARRRIAERRPADHGLARTRSQAGGPARERVAPGGRAVGVPGRDPAARRHREDRGAAGGRGGPRGRAGLSHAGFRIRSFSALQLFLAEDPRLP